MATLSEPIAVAGTTPPETWFEGTLPAVGPADAGATSITVADAVDFDEDGGTLLIGDEKIDYTGIDDDTDTIHLATPLAATWPEGERVTLWPPAFEKYAQVMIGDTGEAIQAVVPHDLWDKILDGIRADGAGEVVTVNLDDYDDFTIVEVEGMEPEVDGGYLLDDTTPPEAWMDGSLYATVGFVDGGFVAGDLFGANVQMSAAGITAANADGEQTFQIDSLTGNVTTVGLYASTLVPNEAHVVIGDLAGTGTTRSFMYFYTGEELDAAGVPITGYAPGEVASGVDTDGTRYIRLKSPDTPGVSVGELSIRSSVDSATRPTLGWSGDIRLRGDAGIVHALNAANARAPLTIRGSALVLDVPNGTMHLGEATGTSANRLRSRNFNDTSTRPLELEADHIKLDFTNGNLIVRSPTAAEVSGARGQLAAPGGDLSIIFRSNDVLRVGSLPGGAFRAIEASAFNVNSDADNKTDAVTVDPKKALEAIRKVRVYDYQRTDDGRTQRGMFAQDLAQHVPIAVTRADEGVTVDIYSVEATNTAAIQALASRLETVEAKTAHMPVPPTPPTPKAR